MIDLHSSNQLMMKSEITKSALLLLPYTSLWYKQIHISDLYRAYRQFSITYEDMFQYQWTLRQYMKNTHLNNKQRKSWVTNLKDILDQSKQSIGANNNLHPTGTLATTFINPAREVNMYVLLVYSPQKIFNYT